VSRRTKRDRRTAGPGAASEEGRGLSAASEEGRGPASSWGLGLQIVFLAVVFGVTVLIAELAGAANLGVALGIGQIAFAIAVVYLLLRR
jgi:uncharacterized membrane protein HdeD (DUF308 family)